MPRLGARPGPVRVSQLRLRPSLSQSMPFCVRARGGWIGASPCRVTQAGVRVILSLCVRLWRTSRLFPQAQLIGIGDHRVEQPSQNEQPVLRGAAMSHRSELQRLPLASLLCGIGRLLAGIGWRIRPPSRDPYSSQAPPAPHTLKAKPAKGLRVSLGTLAAFGKSTLF